MADQPKQGKVPKLRKSARNKGKKWYGLYRTRSQWYVNLIRRLRRHLRKYPGDLAAKAYLDKLPALMKAGVLKPRNGRGFS